jgi:hypothetical protein
MGHGPAAFKEADVARAVRGKAGQSRIRSKSLAGQSNLESLPLFATDDAIGAALLGPKRVAEFKQIVPLLEARGLPKVDQMLGGRYTRAVVAFFDHQYGLDRGGDVPLAPDGPEHFDKWRKQKHRS